MGSPLAAVVRTLGAEKMSSPQSGSEPVNISRSARYNTEDARFASESPPSTHMLSDPPSFFKLPSKYYALVGRSALQDAGGSDSAELSKTRSNGMQRVASEAYFGRMATSQEPVGRPSHVVTGVDITPHYDLYASALPSGSSHCILDQFSKRSSSLLPPPSAPEQQRSMAATAQTQLPPPASASHSQPSFSRGTSLLGLFGSPKSSAPAPASPLVAAAPSVSKVPADDSLDAPHAPAAPAGKRFFSRISAPELLSGFRKPSGGGRRRGGINAKDLNALTPMDM